MTTSLSRRHLFDQLRGAEPSLRPPFSKSEELFLEACNGCQDCISACPENILVPGRGGYPQIDFTIGACTFCGACADACKVDAFHTSRQPEDVRNLRAEISPSCLENAGITCRVCESRCDERAIRFRPALGGRSDIRVDIDLCTGCGACIQSCPEGAISIVDTEQSTTHNLEAIA